MVQNRSQSSGVNDQNREQVNDLFRDLQKRRVTRRQFAARGAALGLSASAISMGIGFVPGAAQDASPAASPAASPGAQTAGLPGSEPGTTSITRAEYEAQFRAAFPFEEVGSPGGTVIIPEISPLQTVNGALVGDATSGTATGFIFESLIGGSGVDGTPVPSLADYWEFAEDGVTFTLYLPENVQWHDGTPFTANDVLFSYDAIFNEDIASPYRASVINVVESYEMVDDYTFQVVMNDRLVTAISDGIQTVTIMPRHIWESVPIADWPTDPGSTGEDPSRVIGTGPFRFVSVEDNGNLITLERNENYYVAEATPNIDGYIIQVFPDSAATIQALLTGDVDVIDTVDFAQVEELQNTEGLDVVTYNTGTFWYYITNLNPETTPLFTDVRTRQALFWALDRVGLVDALTFGYAVVADGTQPVLSYAYAPDQIDTIYRQDFDRARELMAEAGWEDTDGDGIVENADGVPFEVDWVSVSGVAEYDAMLATVQQWWAEIGVSMQPQFVEFATLLEQLDVRDFRVCNLAFNWVVPWDQGAMFNTASIEGGFNYSGYSNEEFDELDAQQARELNFEARVDILIRQSNIVNEDLPVGIILFRDNRVAYTERMRNFFPDSFTGSLGTLPYMWLAGEA